MAHMFKLPALAMAAAGLTLAVPASAAPVSHAAPAVHASVYYDGPASTVYEHGKKNRKHWKRSRDRAYYSDRGYYNDRRDYRDHRKSRPYYLGYDRNYGEPVRRDTRIWRGRDNRYYCRRDNGTTGLLVGAGVGALIGHEVAGRGDRTLGAILGGAAGALLGRTIDRSSTRCG